MTAAKKPNWRSEISIEEIGVYYVKRFSIIPRRINGEFVWLKNYYTEHYDYRGHFNLNRNLTEEEYAIIKLIGKH